MPHLRLGSSSWAHKLLLGSGAALEAREPGYEGTSPGNPSACGFPEGFLSWT